MEYKYIFDFESKDLEFLTNFNKMEYTKDNMENYFSLTSCSNIMTNKKYKYLLFPATYYNKI